MVALELIVLWCIVRRLVVLRRTKARAVLARVLFSGLLFRIIGVTPLVAVMKPGRHIANLS
jgi:hypothetical protein